MNKEEVIVPADSICAGCGNTPKLRFDGAPRLYRCAPDGPLVCCVGCHRVATGGARHGRPRSPGARYAEHRRQLLRMRERKRFLITAVQLIEDNDRYFDPLFEVELWFEKRRNRTRAAANKGINVDPQKIREKYRYLRLQDYKYNESLIPNPSLPDFMQEIEKRDNRSLLAEEVHHLRVNEYNRIRSRDPLIKMEKKLRKEEKILRKKGR